MHIFESDLSFGGGCGPPSPCVYHCFLTGSAVASPVVYTLPAPCWKNRYDEGIICLNPLAAVVLGFGYSYFCFCYGVSPADSTRAGETREREWGVCHVIAREG